MKRLLTSFLIVLIIVSLSFALNIYRSKYYRTWDSENKIGKEEFEKSKLPSDGNYFEIFINTSSEMVKRVDEHCNNLLHSVIYYNDYEDIVRRDYYKDGVVTSSIFYSYYYSRDGKLIKRTAKYIDLHENVYKTKNDYFNINEKKYRSEVFNEDDKVFVEFEYDDGKLIEYNYYKDNVLRKQHRYFYDKTGMKCLSHLIEDGKSKYYLYGKETEDYKGEVKEIPKLEFERLKETR